MTAAMDNAVIIHGLEYTSANLYVNNNIFYSYSDLYMSTFLIKLLMPSYRGATRHIRAMRGARVVSPNRSKKAAH
jgi:hypothetical protein